MTAARASQTVETAVAPGGASSDRAQELRDRVARATLTPSVILQAIAEGDLPFVVGGLSAMSKFDERTVSALIFDRGYLGLKCVFRAAGLPLNLLPAVRIALETLRESGGSVEPAERRRHAERCFGRFLTGWDHLPPGDVDLVLAMLADLHVTDLTAASHPLSA